MADVASLDANRPHCWLDVFPWLRGASSPSATPWWDDSIDEATPAERQTRLGLVSDLAIGRVSKWAIGQILPGLSSHIQLRSLQLPTRAMNALARKQCLTTGDLISTNVDEMMGWENVGIGTVDAIVRVLADASTLLSNPGFIRTGGIPTSVTTSLEGRRLPGWLQSLANDVSTVASWQTAIGLPAGPLLGSLSEGTPDEVRKAHHRLHELSANQVLNEHDLELDAARLLDNALMALDPRAVEVLAKRLFANVPATLEQIGQQLGVTRERVRQIEGTARSAMLDAFAKGPLEMVATSASSLVATVRPLSDMLRLLPAFGGTVKSVSQPVWRVMDRLDDAYEIEDGWCVMPTFSAARTWTAAQLRERADRYGVARIEELDLVETSTPENREELTRLWLDACGYLIDGANVFIRTQSVGDYACAILSITGRPMTSQEIIERFVIERSAGSLRNAMAIDDRFERVDRDRWALSEWGMDGYDGIKSVIRQELANAGGTIAIELLVENITGKYSVTSSSVVAYASSGAFELRRGIVRSAGSSREATKSPERTARLYRRAKSWIYRIRVTHDHLRGSGSMAPMAVAGILNMEVGDKVQLASTLGSQSISWSGPQPSFGTIRRYLIDYDVPADTEIFLIMGDDGSFEVEVIDLLSGNALKDALLLVGACGDLDSDSARTALSSAIRLPLDSPVVSVIGAYRDRGDGDIADMLTSVRHHLEASQPLERVAPTANVDDILDLL